MSPALAQLRPRPLIARRLNATRRFTVSRFHAAPPAATVANSFLSRYQSLGPQTRTQTLDANQLQLLGLTLNHPSLFPNSPSLSNTPPVDTPVPPGYHLSPRLSWNLNWVQMVPMPRTTPKRRSRAACGRVARYSGLAVLMGRPTPCAWDNE